MNRTQKNAWFGLAICLLAIILLVYLFTRMFYVPSPGFTFDTNPNKEIFIVKLWPVFILMATLALFATPRKKQSPAEPDIDERDHQIKQKAVWVGFIAVWLLILLFIIILTLLAGWNGSVMVCCLPSIFLGVFLITLVIYFLAILIQYQCVGRQHTERNPDDFDSLRPERINGK